MAAHISVLERARDFLVELRRRRVFRVALVYLAVGWLVIEVSATIPDALGLPPWVLPLVIVLVAIGFPLAVGLAWAYDVEAGRVVRTGRPEGEPETGPAMLGGSSPPSGASGEKRGEAVGEIRSIAVLPFVNVSADEENEYFTDGITEELLSTLSKVAGLRVAARSSVFALKGRDMDARAVGRHLEVAAVLEGSVRRSESRLRIMAELVDTATGYQLWSEQYDREAGDIFAIQEDISRAIADVLRIRLLRAAGDRSLYRQPTSSLEAYHEYLKGRYHLNRRTRDSLRRAQEAFQRAITADPTFARAYSGLADSYLLLERYGVLPAAEAVPEAQAAARRALEIDTDLAEARNSLAYAFMIGDWDWTAADREFRRAVELDPRYAPGHHWRGWHLARMGRTDEAIASMERALELEPLSLIINANLGSAFYFARRYDDAIRQLEKTLDLNPYFPPALQWLGRALDRAGRTAESVEAQRRTEELLPDDAECVASVGHALARHGDRSAAEAKLEELKRLAERGWVSSYWPGLVLLGLGRDEEAVQRLERAYEERFDWIVFLPVDPMFDPLRDHPGFQRLVDRIG
jgi:TolB-like protein/Tfp pilus assembly protein PilF